MSGERYAWAEELSSILDEWDRSAARLARVQKSLRRWRRRYPDEERSPGLDLVADLIFAARDFNKTNTPRRQRLAVDVAKSEIRRATYAERAQEDDFDPFAWT